MRGENASLLSWRATSRETPPHAWRKQDMKKNAPETIRNTSTCVEKTKYEADFSGLGQKHLHMRGENFA